MASNVFNITTAHNNAKLSLHGDMSLSFNEAVSNTFVVSLFTSSNELFSLDSTSFKFKDLYGNLVSGLIFGGRPGLWIELMFDPVAKIWYITANNLVSQTGGTAEDHSEKTLTFAALPEMTAINYSQGINFRGVLNANAKLANPTNMKPGDKFKIVIVQGSGGSKTLAYDGAYGFYQAVIPTLSINEGKVDVLECYMTGDHTLQCDIKLDYSIVRPLAYGDDFFFTMGAAYEAAMAKPENGQTVRVIRDGWRLECNGTIGGGGLADYSNMNLRVQGVQKNDNTYPLLRLDKNDRPAYGKALVNLENGKNLVVENLRVAGASSDDGNGTGILINNNVSYTLISNVELLENEDGVRSNESPNQEYDLVDVLFQRNGWARISSHEGFSHSIYAGAAKIWRATRCTFSDPVAGHNIKTRSMQTVLNQVYARKSNKGRELDVPDSGLVHAFDCVFWKDGGASQNNLIGIGHEMIGGERYQEYFFVNCYFHNDVDIGRDVTYVENWHRDGTPNSVAVHFIDCEFGGLVRTKNSPLIFKGPYTITLTGGPTGPRVPVGDDRMQFDMNQRDPNRSSNPLGIPLTPMNQLPPMTVTAPTPPYPTFIEPLPPIPPLPSFGADDNGGGNGGGTGGDTTAPTVSLAVSGTTVTNSGSLTLTATATDAVGVAKVEFYRNNVLISTVTTSPYTAVENYTYADNGAISYTAKAYDAAGNSRVSAVRSVTVNIPAPHDKPANRLDAATQAAYDTAITNAAIGSKRIAAAGALVSNMNPDVRLYIYNDRELIIPIEYTGSCTVVDDGNDVFMQVPVTIDSSSTLMARDLAVGSWWFELQGGSAYTRVLTGSVGGPDSGAELVLDQNPMPGQAFTTTVKFIIPRSIDGLS